uniref:Uncharacterized protein n=1 Tax=Rhizophora mucronata TaxID=61149 RepID=A0A2P2NUD9_RHIMU
MTYKSSGCCQSNIF